VTEGKKHGSTDIDRVRFYQNIKHTEPELPSFKYLVD
jgi:hypothetical protein